MILARATYFYLSARCGTKNKEGSCIQRIGDGRVRSARKRFFPENDKIMSSCPLNINPHTNKQGGKILHVRFCGCDMKHCFTRQQRSSKHRVFRCSHGKFGKDNPAGPKTVSWDTKMQKRIPRNNFCTKLFKYAAMRIKWSCANTISPRIRQANFAKTNKQRPQKHHGCTQL